MTGHEHSNSENKIIYMGFLFLNL